MNNVGGNMPLPRGGGVSQNNVRGRMPAPPSVQRPPTSSVQLKLPGFSPAMARTFQPGKLLMAMVTQNRNGNYMLKVGPHTLEAKSQVPLKVGDTVPFRVQGQEQGKIHLQLTTTPFQKQSSANLQNTLSQLKLPVSEANTQLAKMMTEHNVPLTKENFALVQRAASPVSQSGLQGSQLPVQARVGAVAFCQANQIAPTTQNVQVIANFIATSPQLGEQMSQLSTELRTTIRKAGGGVHGKALNELNAMLSKVTMNPGESKPAQGEGGKPKEASPGARKLMRMARESGIEPGLHPFLSEDDDWDLVLRLRHQNPGKGSDLSAVSALAAKLEENLKAVRLMNAGRSESTLGYYYLQVPMRLEHNEFAEVWVQYFNLGNGGREVDPNDTQIEFTVKTAHLGELTYVLNVKGTSVTVDVYSPSDEVRELVASELPGLRHMVKLLGWTPGRFKASFRPDSGRRSLKNSQDFEELDAFDVEA